MVDKNDKHSCEEKSDAFHSFEMKIMFLCKRGRPDTELEASLLSARTSESTEQEHDELMRLLSFIVTSRDDVFCLGVDDSRTLTWCKGASFAACADIRSHASSVFTLLKGSIASGSLIQKRKAHRSRWSKTNGADDNVSKITWTKKFGSHQVFSRQF